MQAILNQLNEFGFHRGTPHLLQHNALLACYKAKFAVSPDEDHAAKERKAFVEGHNLLKGQLVRLVDVMEFLEKHRNMSAKAISCGIESQGKEVRSISRIGLKKLDELEHLLRQYRIGLQQIQVFDHPIHITSSEFSYGPFEISLPIYEWKYKGADIRQAGLMFHLTYLFRYFTCSELPEDVDARLREGVLEFYGPMLGCGKPHTELVAPLMSATFNQTFSPEQVKSRLRDLFRRSKGSKFAKHARFIGWRLPE